jgi:hypothetical protein
MLVNFSHLEMMSKDELWRVAASRKTAEPIRRAAMRQWMSLDETDKLTSPRNKVPMNNRMIF